MVNRSDDIFVTEKTKDEHNSNLEKVLKILISKNLILNFENVNLLEKKFNFSGYTSGEKEFLQPKRKFKL